jgi:hypothetical protein
MRTISQQLAVTIFLATSLYTRGQGFVYDQQSATTPERINYDTFDLYVQTLYQPFVPTFSSIGFVQLELSDYPDTSTSGAMISVALYGGSPQDPTLIGGTERLYLPPNFNNEGIGYSGVADFEFATAIALIPGQTYYLVPVEITGDHEWSAAVTDNTYPYSLYGFNGTDLWFREGIVTVPEPSDLTLLAMGGLLIAGSFWIQGKSTTRNSK